MAICDNISLFVAYFSGVSKGGGGLGESCDGAGVLAEGCQLCLLGFVCLAH